MYPHRIRLAGPWEPTTISGGTSGLRRRFGRPRNLDDWERVWLLQTDQPAAPRGHWTLNGTALTWSQRGDGLPRSDITTMLRERNELMVSVDSAAFAGAYLEIGGRAYVQNVQVQPRRVGQGYGLLAMVDLVSEVADDPLEVYALIDGENFAYRGPLSFAGQVRNEFRIEDRDLPAGLSVTVKIDLICRSTVWDSCELSVAIPAD
jgi:hypothetical protein